MKNLHLHRRGFTLVELLTVIAIIGILAGILVVALSGSRQKAKRRTTKTLLKQLQLSLDSYHSDFHRYPPSTLEEIGIGVKNAHNLGIESLVACLLTQRKNGPYFEYDSKRLRNYDNDSVKNFNDSVNNSGEAYEYVDGWGSPLVYIHAKDYDNPQRVGSYQTRDQLLFQIKAAKDKKTKNYFNLTSYQIWSLGPNRKNENGKGDDIPIW